jgi:protein ImuB
MTEEHAETFALWGIRTFGMLAELPKEKLIARMGQSGGRYRQLALGELPHLFLPIEPPVVLEEKMELDTPVEVLESLLFAVGAMLEQIIRRATARVLALAAVTITLTLEGNGEHTRTVRPVLPTNDRQVWIKLIHLDLEAHPPQAAILSLTLTADPGRTSKAQLGLFSPQLPEPMRLDVTLARIRAIVGEENVGCAVVKDTHKPDELTMKPFTVTSSSSPIKGTNGKPRAAVRQLRPAETATVSLTKSRPQIFIFRGKRYKVESDYGPWLISGDWWNMTQWGFEQ